MRGDDWCDQYAHWLGEQEIDRRSPKSSEEPETLPLEHSAELQAAFQAGWERAMAEYQRATGRG